MTHHNADTHCSLLACSSMSRSLFAERRLVSTRSNSFFFLFRDVGYGLDDVIRVSGKAANGNDMISLTDACPLLLEGY
jgi:hypothetical protein